MLADTVCRVEALGPAVCGRDVSEPRPREGAAPAGGTGVRAEWPLAEALGLYGLIVALILSSNQMKCEDISAKTCYSASA